MNNIIDKIDGWNILNLTIRRVFSSYKLRSLTQDPFRHKGSSLLNSLVSIFTKLFLTTPTKRKDKCAIRRATPLTFSVFNVLGKNCVHGCNRRLVSFILNGRNVLKNLSAHMELFCNDVKRFIICFYFVIQTCQHNNLYSYGY
jgi:hypothetical protein